MKKFIILVPVYNDWKSVSKLLKEIDLQIVDWESEVSVLIINDASTEKKLNNSFVFKNLKSVQIINMKKNWGHARCIAAGLKYINEKEDFDHVISMDGDGEDRPEELYNEREAGIIAQDVVKVLPEAVKERSDGYLAIKYEQMIPLLIEGVKGQQKQIEDLQQQIKEIKNGNPI